MRKPPKPLARLHNILVELMAIADEIETPLIPNEASEAIVEAIHGVLDALGTLSTQHYGPVKVNAKLKKERQVLIEEAAPPNGQPKPPPVTAR